MRTERFTSNRVRSVVYLLAICCTPTAVEVAAADYLGPVDLVASADGSRLFVACADAKQIAVVRIDSGKITRTIAMPAEPTGILLGPNGTRLYVTCAAPKSTVVVLDAASGKTIASITTGHTACGPVLSPDGKTLYVCNRFDNEVAVIDLASGKETARVATAREPIAAAITPDGKTLLVSNFLPTGPATAEIVAAEVTVIDTTSLKTTSIRLKKGSTRLRGIRVSPDGRYAYVVHVVSPYYRPLSPIELIWTTPTAMSVIDVAEKRLAGMVLLDGLVFGAADPWGVAVSPDGETICVTHAGSQDLSVIDTKRLMKKLQEMHEKSPLPPGIYVTGMRTFGPDELAFIWPARRRFHLRGCDLGKLFDPSARHGPRGLAIIGSKVYIAMYFSDCITVIDMRPEADVVTSSIRLGSQPKLTKQRLGQMLFNDASICFQHRHSCASCHPDGRADVFNWDLWNHGRGNPKNIKSILLAHRTAPSMSSADRKNAEEAVRHKLRDQLWCIRPEEDAAAIDAYLKSLEPVPSPHLVDGRLSEAAERGKERFFDINVVVPSATRNRFTPT